MSEILMTNGVQTVPVVRSAFERAWSRQRNEDGSPVWTEAPEGAEETPRVLGLGPDQTVEDYQAQVAEREAQDAAAAQEQAVASAPVAPAPRRGQGGVTPTGDSAQTTPPATS